MPKTAKLENFVMNNAEITENESITSRPTGKLLRKFELKTTFFGPQTLDIYNEVLKKKRIRLQVPEDGVDLLVEVGAHSNSYRGVLEEASPVNINVALTEVDPDLPEEHDLQTAVALEALMNRLRIRSITSLLIEAGVFTNEQFDSKFRELLAIEQETQELQNALIYGYHKPKDEDTTSNGQK